MGQLSDMKESIDRAIREKGLDEYLVKGQISMKAGFMLSLVGESTPDNVDKCGRLRDAAFEVIGARI